MRQKVACPNGICFRLKRGTPDFNELFEPHNLVEDIEKDLWKNKFYGN